MEVELVAYTQGAEELCGMAAATCTASADPMKSLGHAVAAGHTSVLEHASFTFRVSGLSRAALAQLTRHRLASFDVQSQRYVRLGKDMPLVIPESIQNSDLELEARAVMDMAMDLYQRLVDDGVPAEDARYITPQAVPTALVMTMNARELLHFFSLRTCNRAQWEIREMADEMLIQCRSVCPAIFEHAGPGCVTGRCPEARPCGNPREKDEWEP